MAKGSRKGAAHGKSRSTTRKSRLVNRVANPSPEHSILPAGPRLPTELVHMIIALALGEFWADLVLDQDAVKDWDAVLTFLQVSRMFRACTVKYMDPLWGEKFKLGGQSDYKKAMSLLRRYSDLGKISQEDLFNSPNAANAFLNNRIIRTPLIPLVSTLKALHAHVATSKNLWIGIQTAGCGVDFAYFPDVSDLLADLVKLSKGMPDSAWNSLPPRFVDCVGSSLTWTRAHVFGAFVDVLNETYCGMRGLDLIYVPEAEELVDAVTTCLTLSQDCMRDIRDAANIFGLEPGAETQDITRPPYPFPTSAWYSTQIWLDRLEGQVSWAKELSTLWKQTFGTLLSKAERERLLPGLEMPTADSS